MRLMILQFFLILALALGQVNAIAISIEGLPTESEKRSERPLLPERPEHFDPMVMQQQMTQDRTALESQQHLAESSSMLGMYMTELSNYIRLLATYSRLTVLALIGGGILFFFQLLYVRGNSVQTRDMVRLLRDKVDDCKSDTKKISRAYIGICDVKGAWTSDAKGKFYIIDIEVKNFGQTVAQLLVGTVDFRINLSEQPCYSKEIQASILPPSASHFLKIPISAQMFLSDAKPSESIIDASGMFRYQDVFAQEHLLHFKMQCLGEENINDGIFKIIILYDKDEE